MLGKLVGNGTRVAVVGSGISGLSAALRLERAGFEVDLIEREDRLGGRFGVGNLGDRPVMMGGKNIGRRYHAFRAWLDAIGHYQWESFGINTSFMKEDEVLTLDSTRRGRSLANIRRMSSPRDLARLAAMAARIRLDESNKFLGSAYFTELSRRHDHQPLSAHFGEATANVLLRPMTVRMNGAEPDEVYLGTFGTNLALMLDHYDQLVHSIQPALEAFSRRVTVRLNTTVESLVVRDGRITGVRLSEQGGPVEEVDYAGVIVAVPAYAAADIVRDELPGLAKRLSEVRYNPSSVMLVEYDRPVFSAEVRALAIHDGGPCSNAGSYGMNDRHIVRYTFSGAGAKNAELSPEQLDTWVGQAEQRLTRYLGVTRAKPVRSVGKIWPAAYSAYLPYHGDFLNEVHRSVQSLPGLELSGDYLWGVSIEACTRAGNAAGDRLVDHLALAPAVGR
ncbi:protoporphyrinogen/coproporphyrinogen oxidase [Kitasatospora cheerisanensis]|uniref:FAD dependent oxidoreductase n=1 Tax=Kitasatospora cheerisanensis KCTC 2395 TaxID=1348663 RepID=A0A066YV46_9ACTN|nr:FAD-dependent oxidoreductase [Kitasatospora cheerisanensis]KDN83849.1 FAD dependent oxidoreductase [Kitasatospora cheerisanensis KCTC 2395]